MLFDSGKVDGNVATTTTTPRLRLAEGREKFDDHEVQREINFGWGKSCSLKAARKFSPKKVARFCGH